MSATCPRGHSSESTDYCDVCGALIGPATTELGTPSAGTPSAGAAEPAAAAAGLGDVTCARCGTVNPSSAAFCEDCGLDFSAPVPSDPSPPSAPPSAGTPAAPSSAAAPAKPSGWEAHVVADQAYFARTDPGDAEFPADCPERVIPLPAGEVTIGRRSASSGTTPTIDLGGPPEDIGVSHAHAILTQTADGSWSLTDQDSMNGTYLGDSDTALTPNQPIPVNEGDAIHIGAWTTITVRRAGAAI